jgi:hypothetical protein
MYTLNQLVSSEVGDLKKIADAHTQINSYGFGDPWEFATSGVTHYPAMFVVLNPGSMPSKSVEYNVSILFMDVPHRDESNETEVLSDMILIAADVYAQLQHPDYSFIVEDGPIYEDFTENLGDLVAGVKLDLTIRAPFENDRCAIPADAITITTNTDRT